MQIDRTSCTSFWANQFRLLMTAAAYVLMQELRLRLVRTSYAWAQISTLRERLLKIGVRVVVSVRRILLHFPSIRGSGNLASPRLEFGRAKRVSFPLSRISD